MIRKTNILTAITQLTRLPQTNKMPAFTLYGSLGSSNTDRVRLTLAEGGFTDYELVQLNLRAGEQKVENTILARRSIQANTI